MKNAGWRKVSEKVIRAGSKRLFRKTYRLPHGGRAAFDIYDEGEIVTILALTKEHRVLLTRQFRPGPERVFLELPGGRVDPGERPAAAARRELLEETGYQGKMTYLGASYDRAYTTLVRHNFTAVDCVKVSGQNLDDTEFIDVVLMDLGSFRKGLKRVKWKGIETAYLGLDRLGLL